MNEFLLLALAPVPVLGLQASQASAQAGSQATAHATAGATQAQDIQEVAFFEIPDLHKLLSAYAQAPLAQMVRDPAVRESANGLLKSAGIEIGPALAKALEQLGAPAEVATAPLEALRGMADTVSSASLSLALNGEPEALSDALGKSLAALNQIQELEKKVAAHAEANEGYPPATLGELDLPAEMLLDPWGHPFELEVDLGSLAAQVRSLGADGQPGGEGFAADLSLSKAASDLPEQILPRAVRLIVEVAFVDKGARELVAERAIELAAQLGWEAEAPRQLELRGETGRVCELRDPHRPQRSVWLLEHGTSLLAGYGNGSLEHAVARSREVRRSALPTPELTALASHLEAPSGATVVQGWMRFDPLERFLAGLERELEKLPDMRVGHMPIGGDGLFRMRLDGERFVSEMVTRNSVSAQHPELEILECFGHGPVPDSLWNFVPAESIGVYAMSIDGEKLYDKILAALGAAGEQQAKGLAELEKRYGFSLQSDLIGNLGGGAAAYLLPISGLTIPGIALVVELRDPERFQSGLDGVLKLLEEQAGGEFTVRYKPYRDLPMWTFSFGGEEGMATPFSVSPSIAIVENHLLVTLTSLRAKKEIKRLQEEPGERHPLLAGEDAPPADATTIGYMDWPSLIEGSYENARKTLAMFSGFSGGEMPFDPELLPAAHTFTRFFKPTHMWSHQPAPGVRATRIESSFGPETWLGLIGGAGALALGVRAHSESLPPPDHEEEELELPSEEPEHVRAAISSSEALSEVATRLEVFRIDVGRYPGKLEELLAPTTNFPRGYMGQDRVPTDGWGRVLVYRVAQDGASYTLWSLGANGADERGSGDDVRVP